MSSISFSPPILNSATPWATTKEQLAALYGSPYTGAVTTRTTLLEGFPHDPSVHQHAIFPTSSSSSGKSSLNTYGYSPHPLSYYLSSIKSIVAESGRVQRKPFIISVTGSPSQVTESVSRISSLALEEGLQLLVEVNLSCPNIAAKPPPAYDLRSLQEYLSSLESLPAGSRAVPIGLKTPPYTYSTQFTVLIEALRAHPVVSFITATNTLGSSLHLRELEPGNGFVPTLASEAGTGVGGLAGEALHWLALGNVSTIRNLLNQEERLRNVAVIGVGGVSGREAAERMWSVGAAAVAVGTAFGDKGVGVFEEIAGGCR
ncbi:dihydroorotate dehydrogenase [Rhizina undulata]